MPGVFSKSARPKRPGAYFNFEADVIPTVAPSAGAVVAVPFTHNWGPFKRVTSTASFAEWQALYGSTGTTPGYLAVKQAFVGEGLPGRGGAAAVVSYRTGGSAAAKAAVTLQNTAGTPANALTLTARYEGTRGNALRVTTQDYAGDSTKNELVLLDGTVELERYRYADTDVADLAAQINATSDWVTANSLVTGTSLATVSSSALTGGNDGTTLTSGDWTDSLSVLEVERFGVFAPYNLTDSSILASVKTWAVNLNQTGKRFFTVVGGSSGEDVITANTRAATLADPDFINIGVGSYEDTDTLDVNGNPTQLSTAQLVPRIAGILANRGEAQSITFARLANLNIVSGPTESNVLSAFDGGTLVLSRDSHPTAPVRVEKGLTTFIDTTDDTRPYLIYRQPKYVRTMQGIETEITEWAEANVIGQLQISDKVREFIVGETKARLESRVASGVLQPGPTVEVDPDPPPQPEDEFVALRIGVAFGRSIEQVFFTAVIA